MKDDDPYALPATDQRELVLAHAGLVKRIAFHLIARMPSSVDVDDLIQAGTIGLIMAGRNFSPNKGANFETYAGIRIRGAMIDEVRHMDWTPRSVHRKTREVLNAASTIENQTGRKATDQELADELEITLDDLQKIVRDAAACKLLSLDGPEDEEGPNEIPVTSEPNPEEAFEKHNQIDQLAEYIEKLPERERFVLSMYYDDELNLREIGEVLGVTESRVSQIHSQALMLLRSYLHE